MVTFAAVIKYFQGYSRKLTFVENLVIWREARVFNINARVGLKCYKITHEHEDYFQSERKSPLLAKSLKDLQYLCRTSICIAAFEDRVYSSLAYDDNDSIAMPSSSMLAIKLRYAT